VGTPIRSQRKAHRGKKDRRRHPHHQKKQKKQPKKNSSALSAMVGTDMHGDSVIDTDYSVPVCYDLPSWRPQTTIAESMRHQII
jgi:hypothetical protein